MIIIVITILVVMSMINIITTKNNTKDKCNNYNNVNVKIYIL